MFLQSLNTKSNLEYKDFKIVSHFDKKHSKTAVFFELLQLGHISAGNKSYKINTELSMATIYIFTVAMVTILMVFHLSSSSPPQSQYNSSSSAPAKNRRQKVGDSLILS